VIAILFVRRGEFATVHPGVVPGLCSNTEFCPNCVVAHGAPQLLQIHFHMEGGFPSAVHCRPVLLRLPLSRWTPSQAMVPGDLPPNFQELGVVPQHAWPVP
jgi:hypothetical protein